MDRKNAEIAKNRIGEILFFVFFDFFAVTSSVFESAARDALPRPLRLTRGEGGRRPGEVSNQTAEDTNHAKKNREGDANHQYNLCNSCFINCIIEDS